MPPFALNFSLLFVSAFSLAAWLEPRLQTSATGRSGSGDSLLAVLLGDSRRLFAQQFFVKADVYFHSGYYPSIFDVRPSGGLHLAEAATESDHSGHSDGLEFLGPPQDWLDRFSRQFYPSQHLHLGERPHPAAARNAEHAEHGEHDDHAEETAAAGEILPWLRIAVELDPQRPETYVVASYWLRSRLNKPNEAEQFLREGLQHNPGNSEILFELGRIYREHRHDTARARNLWELGLKKWRETQAAGAEPNPLLGAQLLGNLAKLEEDKQQYARAIQYLEELATLSPHKEHIQSWLESLRPKLPPAASQALQ